MADIFGRENTGFGGAFNSAQATMTISNIDHLLVVNVQITYNQGVSRIFEVASDKTFYVIGRVQGQGSLGSVIGPKGANEGLYATLADPCDQSTMTFSFSGSNCDTNVSVKRQVHGIILQNVGFALNAQDMLINENLGFQFAWLGN